MDRIEFGLSGGLSPTQVKTVHDAALRILSETGLACQHAPTVEVVTGEAGVRYEGGRLRFAPDLVEAVIARARVAGRRYRPADRLRVTGPVTALNIIDMETDQVRRTRAADLPPMLKLVATFNQGGWAPVYPWDLDERIQIPWLEKMCLELTPGHGGSLVTHDPAAIRWIGEMYAAVGRRYTLVEQFIISPLRLDHVALDLLLRYRDDPVIGASPSICPMPVAGTTAPLSAPGLLAQGIAESLGALIVAQRLGLAGDDSLPAFRVDYGDMRYVMLAYSLPENVMIQLLLSDLYRHFAGRPLDAIYLNTNAKRADPLAAADRVAYMLMLGLAGFRHFYMGAGLLSMDETFSPAQCLIDMELGRYVQSLLDGVPWPGENAEALARTVAEGAAEGSYLAHPSTRQTLPQLFDSRLFRRDSVAQWRAAGEPSVERLALDRAREIIASYHFELPPSKQADLDRVFAEGCRAMGVDAASQPIPRP